MTLKEADAHMGKVVKNSRTQATYRLVGLSKRWCNQGIFFQAELEDLKAKSSICVCRVDDIVAVKEESYGA